MEKLTDSELGCSLLDQIVTANVNGRQHKRLN